MLSIGLFGSLDLTAIQLAFADVVERHEILHTTFPANGETARQSVDSHLARPELDIVAFARAGRVLSHASTHQFDLEREIPVHGLLMALTPAEHVLMLIVHPIAIDDWSVRPLVNDLSVAYTSRLSGRAPEWLQTAPQYVDWLLRRQDLLGQGPQSAVTRQLNFWARTLEGPLRRTSMGVVAGGRSNRDEAISIAVAASLHDRLRILSKDYRVNLFMVWHAALSALMTKLGACSDIAIGTVVSGRADPAMDGLVGPVSNTVVLRVDTSGNPTFAELLSRVRVADLNAFANQDVPFESVRSVVRTDNAGRLFQIMLLLRDSLRPVLLPGLVASVAPISSTTVDCELVLDIAERHASDGAPAGIEGRVEYASPCFSPDRAESIVSDLLGLLETAVTDPGRRLDAIGLRSELPQARVARTDEWTLVTVPKNDGLLPPSKPYTGVDPQVVSATRPEITALYETEMDPLQAELIQIWQDVLGIKRIGLWDDFFELGGSDELWAEVLRRFEQSSGQRLAPSLAGTAPTIERLADAVWRDAPFAPVQRIQSGDPQKTPLFFLHGDIGGGGFYTHRLSRELGLDQPFYVLPPQGLRDGQRVPSSVEDMAADHLQALLMSRPEPPYYLGGYCNGAVVAFEMARLLEQQNREVALLLLVDAPFTGVRGDGSRPVASTPPEPPQGWTKSSRARRAWLFTKYVYVVWQYTPKPYDGRVVLVWAREHNRYSEHPRLGWQRVAKNLEFTLIPGDHSTTTRRHVPELAAAIKPFL